MSYEDAQQFEVGGNEAESYRTALLKLNDYLERTANSINPDYADDLEDSSHACVESVDRGAGLTTTLTFEAKKFRDLLGGKDGSSFGYNGEVVTNEYTVTSAFVCKEDVTLSSFPGDVQESIRSHDYPESYLNDSETEYAIGLFQTFTITSDCEFDHDYELLYYVDHMPFTSPNDAIDGPGEVTDKGLEVSESTVALQSLAENFSAEDLAFLEGFGEDIIRDYSAHELFGVQDTQRVLAKFLAYMPRIELATPLQRLEMVRNIVGQITVPSST